jgi:maltooligosyltrehalose trehalohydrolase
MPVGAEVVPGGAHFRVWAPRRARVAVVLDDGREEVALQRDSVGYFAGFTALARAGTHYRLRLDEDERLYPDPASRFQPEGPHGPSEVVDPSTFVWSDAAHQGLVLAGQVLYELHIGTFTAEGTYAAAAARLSTLRDLGITAIEIMPVADFAGRFGWGYDGVNLYAPSHLYGTPDDLRALVDRAHALGLGVVLDVVYNHLGPDGNYLGAFADAYFTDRYHTEWGAAINYDGPDAGPVREFMIENAAYWIREFHFDGLRFDATQSIFDNSSEHVISAMARRCREAAGRRSVILVAENEQQQAALVRPPDRGGLGLDAVWNDDLHHTIVVAATGHKEAYYTDYLGSPQEFVSAAKWGYLYQGQRYAWQEQRRGTPALDLDPAAFVVFLENHDQVANTARGLRLHQVTTPGRYRALSALVLLLPATPMLFQGQEFASSRPFYYFADHERDLAELVRKGRGEFLEQFVSMQDPALQARLRDPGDERTFQDAVLDWTELDRHSQIWTMYRDLLTIRRTDRAVARQARRALDGAVLGPEAFVLRFFAGEPGDTGHGGPHDGDRLLVVNLGRDLAIVPAPEPLLAPPPLSRWELRWSSEDPVYGGSGTPPIESPSGEWSVPGHAAFVLGTVAGAPERRAHTRRTA